MLLTATLCLAFLLVPAYLDARAYGKRIQAKRPAKCRIYNYILTTK